MDSISKYEEREESYECFDVYQGFTKDDVILSEEDIKSITKFKQEYPILSKEFQKVQLEQLALTSRKMLDYGKGNITLGGDMSKEEDRHYSLLGIQIRLNDKINRLKQLLKNKKNYVEGESIEDTFIDIANYGILAMLVGRKKW